MLRLETFRSKKIALSGHSLSLGLASHGEGFFIGSAMETKKCNKCGIVQVLSDFPKRAYGKPGVRSICKACAASYASAKYRTRIQESYEYSKQYRENNRQRIRDLKLKDYYINRDKILAKAKEMREERPWMANAYSEMGKAIRSGQLVNPLVCEDCGTKEGRIVAHHDDYSKPIDVRWLCKPCHGHHHGPRYKNG